MTIFDGSLYGALHIAPMDQPSHLDDNALLTGEAVPAPTASADDLSWAIVKMRAGEPIVVNEAL
ncbi:MAG: hypothetical protein K2P79_12200, partial [Sphingomonas sp.]|nr:hypothetical protein [Sphingomonas sp.]